MKRVAGHNAMTSPLFSRWVLVALALSLSGCAEFYDGFQRGLNYSQPVRRSVVCPEDGMEMWNTGIVRVSDFGVLLHEYQCPVGHTGWLR